MGTWPPRWSSSGVHRGAAAWWSSSPTSSGRWTGNGRCALLAVEVIDPRDLDLPAVGLVTLVDPETGRSKEVSTSAGLRSAFAKAAAEHRAQVAGALRRAGAAQLVLRTDGDWIGDVLRFIVGRKRGWTGATAPGTPNRTPRGGEAWQ